MKSNNQNHRPLEEGQLPVALIGIGCRFPGNVRSPQTFWELLRDGVDGITDVPPERWNVDAVYHPDRPPQPGKTYTRKGGFITDVDKFDAAFFGISPREAVHMDPQQRLLLEVAWEAFEDAGLNSTQIQGSQTGVFIGQFTNDYGELRMSSVERETISAYTALGKTPSITSNRISYIFDLHGPSFTLDTACSSSLLAVHLACQSLQQGECHMAIAGGCNLILRPEMTIATSHASMLSAKGHCHSFAAEADGYVRAEGVAVVLLKPLAQALQDGDPIYAVIRGSATNQDGRTNGITVPNGEAQKMMMYRAYQQAGIEPRDVQYLEAHGTGTPVGDPIEAQAIGQFMGVNRPSGQRLIMGSVKSNFGHTEGAAGVAGLIKAALMLQHKQIPPNLHFDEPNPEIPFAELDLRVPTQLQYWPEPLNGVRIAGVNSFGYGGTNAHVVLTEAPVQEQFLQTKPGNVMIDVKLSEVSTSSEAVQPTWTMASPEALLLPLSARSAAALPVLVQLYLDWFDRHPTTPVRDVGYSAGQHRTHHNHRLALVASGQADLVAKLQAYAVDNQSGGIFSDRVSPNRTAEVVFVFSGMGPQWWAMGRDLLQSEPIFQQAIEECDALFRPLAGWSLVMELTRPEADSRINETQIAQPAIFALQVGLAALWQSWGVKPTAIVGHSVGEVAAAYVAGALNLADAVQVIYHRSRLQQRTAGQGTLLAVGLPMEAVQELLADYDGKVSVAAINSPQDVTIAGEEDALQRIALSLQKQGSFHRFLRVEVPYHSPLMEPLKQELLTSLANIHPQAVSTPLYSTVSGIRVTGVELDAAYWWHNVRHPVQFASAIAMLAADGYDVFLEISAHPVLAPSILECLPEAKNNIVLPSLRRQRAEHETLFNSLGRLYALGLEPDWAAIYPQGRFVSLPTYPWQRERYWLESTSSHQARAENGAMPITLGQAVHPLLGMRLPTRQAIWQTTISQQHMSYIKDHRALGELILPGAAYVEMALAAARQELETGKPFEVTNVYFRQALLLMDINSIPVQIELDDAQHFRIYGQHGTSWTLHAEGQVKHQANQAYPIPKSIDDLKRQFGQPIMEQVDCYRQLKEWGFDYGPSFQGIRKLWRNSHEILCKIQLPKMIAGEDGYILHPAALDIGWHCAVFFGEGRTILPVSVERLRVYDALPAHIWSYVRLVQQGADEFEAEMQLLDGRGQVLVEVKGLYFRYLDSASTADNYLYEYRWEPQALIEKIPLATRPDNWLVFVDQQGAGKHLEELLLDRGQKPILVTRGDNYKRFTPSHYQISPTRPGDFMQLLQEVPTCQGIIHLWSLDIASTEQLTAQKLNEAQDLSCLSTMHLVQALESVNWPEMPRLWLVSGGAYKVIDEDVSIAVAQAPLWGLGRVITNEQPDLQCKRVDLSATPTLNEIAAVVDELGQNSTADEIAWRGSQRYVHQLKHITPPQVVSGRMPAPQFRPDGTYLITGGLGNFGSKIARWMVAHGARCLVLVGRSGAERPEAQVVVAELEAMGAEVVIAKADITQEEEVAQVVRQIRLKLPPLRGIIHAAVVLDDATLIELDTPRWQRVSAPKMLGAWNLHRLTLEDPLDFFSCTSSISATVGTPGQGNYVAANCFLDALAHYRVLHGLSASSINWGLLEDIGGARSELQKDKIYANLLRGGWHILPIEKALQWLGYSLMQRDMIQVTIAPMNWNRWNRLHAAGHSLRFAHLAVNENERRLVKTDLLSSNISPDQQPLLSPADRLQQLTASILQMPVTQLDDVVPLATLGFDSLMMVELRNSLKTEFNVTMSIGQLIGTTVHELIILLEQQDIAAAPIPVTTHANNAEAIASRLAETATTGENTAQLLKQIDNLSSEEIDNLSSEEADKLLQILLGP